MRTRASALHIASLRLQVAGLFVAWLLALAVERFWFPALVGLGAWAAWSWGPSLAYILGVS